MTTFGDYNRTTPAEMCEQVTLAFGALSDKDQRTDRVLLTVFMRQCERVPADEKPLTRAQYSRLVCIYGRIATHVKDLLVPPTEDDSAY